MAFEPVFEVVKINSKRRLAKTQAVVEAKLLPAPNTVIARVLSITADSVIGASEVFTGEIRYNGRVNFKVLFVDVDGHNHSMDYNADFSDKLEDAAITSHITPYITADVLDTDVLSVSAGELKLASVVEIKLDAVMEEEVKYLSSGGEGLYTHDDNVEYSRLVASGSGAVTLSATLPDVKIVSILLAEHKAVVNSRSAGVDSVRVEGVVISDICGETADGLIASYRVETPFSEEFGAADARPSDIVLASASVSGTSTPETDGEVNAAVNEYALKVDYCVYTDASFSVITDAFSVTHELLTTTESVSILKPALNETVTDRVEGNVTLEVNMPIVDNILAATALRLNVTNVVALDGEALIEGIVSGNIIYYSAEADSKNSVAVELPFSLKSPVSGISEGDEIIACGEVTAVTLKIRRGNEIDIRADICVEIQASSPVTKCIITELTQGEMRELPSSAISIHIAKSGETLWDVAKALGSTPELVMLQNPDITLPLSGGERVIVYRHLTK